MKSTIDFFFMDLGFTAYASFLQDSIYHWLRNPTLLNFKMWRLLDILKLTWKPLINFTLIFFSLLLSFYVLISFKHIVSKYSIFESIHFVQAYIHTYVQAMFLVEEFTRKKYAAADLKAQSKNCWTHIFNDNYWEKLLYWQKFLQGVL